MENRTEDKPPALASRFLKWYCADHYLEDLEGDLFEYYIRRLKKSGKIKADFMYTVDVIRNCKLFLMKKSPGQRNRTIQLALFMHNLKTITRNLMKSKFYAGINMAGLAIGIAGSLFIWKICEA